MMAIGTYEQRLSMLNFGSIWSDTLPEADSAINPDDRWHLLGLYSGHAATSTGGELHALPAISGRVRVLPAVLGEVNVVPAVDGSIKVKS